MLNVGKKRVWIDPSKLSEVKEAITKFDIRSLLGEKSIKIKPKGGISRYRARERITQKRKGRRKGTGTRKGKMTARLSRKRLWITTIRVQRLFLRRLMNKKMLTPKNYRLLYQKSKGGFFRSVRHIKTYLEDKEFVEKNEKK